MSFVYLQTEVCDETFTKECSISFIHETSNMNVVVCYNKAGKICDDEKTSELSPATRQAEDESTCVDVFDTGQPFHSLSRQRYE